MIRQPTITVVDTPDGRHQLQVNGYSVAIFPLGPIAQSDPKSYATFVAKVLERALLQESLVLPRGSER